MVFVEQNMMLLQASCSVDSGGLSTRSTRTCTVAPGGQYHTKRHIFQQINGLEFVIIYL